MANHFNEHRQDRGSRFAYDERGERAAYNERASYDEYVNDYEWDAGWQAESQTRETLGKYDKQGSQWSSRDQVREQGPNQAYPAHDKRSTSRKQGRMQGGIYTSPFSNRQGQPQEYGRLFASKKKRVSGKPRAMDDVLFTKQPTIKKHKFLKRLIVAVAIVAIIAAVFAAMNAGYKSPYTWSNLTWDANGRPSYVVDGKVQSMLGVDVSDHCKEIDWEAVAADGIKFAYIRLGWRGYSEGVIHLDEQYRTYITGAKTAGLKVGVYFFSQATTKYEASEEAQFVLDNLGVEDLDLPIVFDHETVSDPDGRANNLDTATITGITERFCSTLEAAGYQTMIYGNLKDMARLDPSVTKDRAVWVAQYETDHPAAQFDFSMWQYTESDHVNGISTAADIDIWFTSVLPLEKYKYLKQGSN